MGGKYAIGSGRTVNKIFQYVKIGLVLLLLVFIVWDLRDDDISNADIETVAESVAKAAGMDGLQPAGNRMVKRFYGLNPKDYEGAVLYAPKDNMDANELFIVKLSDVSQSDAVVDAIEERLETQKNSFEGYGAEQTKLLNDHVLQVEGNFILYAVGEQAKDVQAVFLNSL